MRKCSRLEEVAREVGAREVVMEVPMAAVKVVPMAAGARAAVEKAGGKAAAGTEAGD